MTLGVQFAIWISNREENMRSIIRVAFFAVILATVAPIIPAAPVEDELNRLEEARYAALVGADWQALDALLADEFFYNTATGATLTKSAFVDYMRSGAAVVRKAVRDDTPVRAYGDVVLVTGIVHVDVTLKGEDKTLHSRYLHVWAKQGDSWRLAARQATYLPEKK
jgi:ketosteroid isomerase-like protein